MKLISFFLTSWFLFNQFSSNDKETFAPNENTIKLDISKAITDTDAFLSKLKITKVVKLKGDTDTYISASRKIIDRDNKIYICDYIESNLSIFDYEGNYLSKVGAKGRGPGEFNRIFDFTILDDGSYVVIDRNGLIQFNKDKKYVSYLFQNPIQICYMKGNEYAVYFGATKYSKSTNHIMVYDTDYNVKEKYSPFPEETEDVTTGFFDIGGIKATPFGMLYNELSSPVYHEVLNDGTVYPKYEITGNAHIWPYEKRNQIKSFAKMKSEEANIIYPYYQFQENSNAFIFTLTLEDQQLHTFYYDKISKKLYKPALMQEAYMAAFFKPIFGLGMNQKHEFIIPVYMNWFYRNYNKNTETKSALTKYFPELLTLAEGTDEYSNPALVYFTFGE